MENLYKEMNQNQEDDSYEISLLTDFGIAKAIKHTFVL